MPTLNRDYTDKHPNENCAGCSFNIIQHAKCTYRSKHFWCIRDEWEAQERAKDGLLFDL